jgi:hypothetical protein
MPCCLVGLRYCLATFLRGYRVHGHLVADRLLFFQDNLMPGCLTAWQPLSLLPNYFAAWVPCCLVTVFHGYFATGFSCYLAVFLGATLLGYLAGWLLCCLAALHPG